MSRSLLQTWITFSILLTIGFMPNPTCAAVIQDETRTWKSANGKFSVVATIERVNGDTVILKDTKRKTIKVPLSKLSVADQKFIEELGSRENPFQVIDENVSPAQTPKEESDKTWKPVKNAKVEIKWGSRWYPGEILDVKGDNAFLIHYTKYSNDTWDEVVTRDRIRQSAAAVENEVAQPAAKASSKSSATTKSKSNADYVLIPGDTSHTKEISIDNPSWNLETISPRKISDVGKRRVKLPSVPFKLRKDGVFAMNRAQTVGFLGGQNGVGKKLPQLFAFDLAAGKLLWTSELPFDNHYFRDVNTDGSVLLSSSGSWSKSSRFDRWKVRSNGRIDHIGGVELNKKVAMAWLTASDEVLVQDTWGQVTLWNMDLKKPQAIFTLPSLGLKAHFSLSQDKGLLLGATSKQIFAVDLSSKKCIGSIEHDLSVGIHYASGPIAATGDRSKVALAVKNRVLVWGNDGEKIADFYVPGDYRSIRWLDNRCLISGRRVIDTQSGIELCNMEMPWWFTIDGRTDYWMFDSETEKFGNAPAMIKDFKSLVPTDLHRHIVLGVGDTVALDIEFAMPAQARKEVRASLTRQLSKRGVTLDSASNVRIKISQKITTESKQYRDRFYGSLSTVKAKRYDQTIALVNGNQTLLSHRELLGGTPNTLKMKEGETVQQAFERTRPELSYDFFKNFALPNVIAAHPDQKPFSSITFDAF